MSQGIKREIASDYVELVPLRSSGGELGVISVDKLPKWSRRNALMLLTFVLPSLLAILYYGFVAADRYTSEAQFIVRSPSRAHIDQLTNLVQTTGTTRAPDEASAVHEFMRSRDAVALLVSKADLRKLMGRPEADPVWGFPGWFSRDLQEKLFDRYLDFISIKQDSATGISTLVVQAFRPEDAVRIAQVLLDGSEALINRLNERARRDTIQAAEHEVEIAKSRAFERREELTAFRTRAGTVDPAKSSQNLLETIGKLSFEVAQASAQLAEAMRNSPQGPQIANLRNRIQATEQQIVQEKQQIGGSAQALAPIIADYERLVLEREFADRALASALSALENARMDAQRQQLYLERIVEPNAADYPGQPKRLMWIAISVVLSFSIYVILRTLISNVSAHQP